MAYDYDILIAGAGPAGCAAAYDLARSGRRALLLDRRIFPRAKACACGLTRKTLAALRYSVEPVVERVCHEIILQSANGSEKLRIRTRNPISAMAVRERFDAFCLEQTLAAGAAFKKIESITALREHAGHVELDIATADGNETLTAPILIGADGSNGQTRKLANAAGKAASPSAQDWFTRSFALETTIPYAALPSALPGGIAPHDFVFDFAPLPGGYGWLFPKGDHINIGVGVFAPHEDGEAHLKLVSRELLSNYIHAKLGIDHARLETTVTGQHLGMGGHAYIPSGRVLLTGDAAGLADPLTGEGIHSAIVSGQAAAAAILSGESNVAAAYARHLRPLQQTLAFSHRAACHFYAAPERGFRVMRTPLLRSLVLRTYADGVPHTGLIATLARFVT